MPANGRQLKIKTKTKEEGLARPVKIIYRPPRLPRIEKAADQFGRRIN